MILEVPIDEAVNYIDLSRSTGWIILYNVSPYDLEINFSNVNVGVLISGTANKYRLCGESRLNIRPIQKLNVAASPTSTLLGEYSTTEPSGFYPVSLVRQTAISSTGALSVTTTSALVSTDQAAGTKILDVAASGDAQHRLIIDNTGAIYFSPDGIAAPILIARLDTLADKSYVDNGLSGKLGLAGGALTGPITVPSGTSGGVVFDPLPGSAVEGGQLTLRGAGTNPDVQMDLYGSNVRWFGTGLQVVSLDMVNGLLALPGSPTDASHATRKDYVDGKVAKTGDVMSGGLTIESAGNNIWLRNPNWSATNRVQIQLIGTGELQIGYFDAAANTFTLALRAQPDGRVYLSNDPTTAMQPATKGYVDAGDALEAVQGAALVNGWTAPAGFRPPGYYKDRGRVYLDGVASGNAQTSATAFVLPVGYRPSAPVSGILQYGAGGWCTCRVTAAGEVQMPAYANIYLNTMSFRV